MAIDDGVVVESARLTSLSLRDQALDILRQRVLDGDHAPGDRLNEVEIAESLGISRGPVREALQRLAAEGLVESVPRRGAFVRRFTVEELHQMYEFREIVEAGAAGLAALRASAEDVAELRAMLTATERMIASDEQGGYPTTSDFHRRILELAENPALLRAGTELQTQVQIARQASSRHPGRSRAALEEHFEILEAIARHDADAAADAMQRHLGNSFSTVAHRSTVTDPSDANHVRKTP